MAKYEKLKIGDIEVESIYRNDAEKGIFISYPDSVKGEVSHEIERTEAIRMVKMLNEFYIILSECDC